MQNIDKIPSFPVTAALPYPVSEDFAVLDRYRSHTVLRAAKPCMPCPGKPIALTMTRFAKGMRAGCNRLIKLLFLFLIS
jgi:hypothetical protein